MAEYDRLLGVAAVKSGFAAPAAPEVSVRQTVETRRTCVISMAHLAPATVAMLRERRLDSWPFLGAPLGPDMIIAYAHTEDGGAEPIPRDVWACIEWARRQGADLGANPPRFGFEYIIFDRDVDPAEDGSGLPDLSQ